MTAGRWPALLVIPALLIAAVVVDRSRDETIATEAGGDATRSLEEQGLLPVAAPATALGATWYCAGGTVGEEGDADHTVIVANPGDTDLAGTITVYGDATAEGESGPVEAISVGARSTIEVRVADIAEVADGQAAALVELAGGEAVVEHRISGPDGTDVSACSPTASPTWYFAAGSTTKDAVETLVFFNPFPDDAVVDVSFRTDQDLRTPQEFEGLVVPGQSVIARDVGEVVTRREHVSASVVARSGRLVVDRIQSYDGSEGPKGLTVSLGAPVPSDTWYFPDGAVGNGVEERMVVYNPTDSLAEVDLEIVVDDVARSGEVEPFELTVPPEGFEEILLNEEARITSARGGGEGSLTHASIVRSVNGVPIVAERQLVGGSDSDLAGVDLTLGSPLLSDEVVLAAGPVDGGAATVSILNPVSAQAATVAIMALEDGELSPVDGVDDLTVPGAGRLLVPLDRLADGTSLVVSADQPVVVERRLVFDGDVSGAIAVPVAGSLSKPPG